MRLCVVSFKECWQDERGIWWSSGGFPLQMAALASLFDETTLVVCRGARQRGGIPLPSGAGVVALPTPTGTDLRRKLSVLARSPYYVARLAWAIRHADAVHIPLPGDIPLLGMLIALVGRKRLIARYGGSWARNAQTTVMNGVTRFCMRLFAGGRNVMLATGVGERPPARGMTWIFATALSRRELDRIDARSDGPPGSPLRLVYVGRLAQEKGVANLLRAIAHLRAEGACPVPTVMVAGDGPERRALERLAAELGCADAVTFLGQLDRAALSEQMRRADVCVQPSLTEGFSKAWLEALAHGVPVLSSDVGAARAVIGSEGERGWLVSAGDVPGLAATLQAVSVNCIDWPALRARCRAYVRDRTLEAWAQEIGERCAEQWGVRIVNERFAG